MKLKSKILGLMIFGLLALGMNSNAYSFEDTKDSTENKDKKEWSEWEDWEFWDNKVFFYNRFESPTIEFQYGLTQSSIHENEFQGKFADLNVGEIRLGYTKKKQDIFGTNLIKYSFDYIFLKHLSKDISSEKEIPSGQVEANIWSFGVSNSSGYGYDFGSSADLILYHTSGISWTKLDFKNVVPDSMGQRALDVYGDQFRFGKQYEGGIKFQVFSPLSINASYQRSIVFPRFMFWYWAGSEILEGIAQGMVDHFAKKIVKNSTIAGPIMYFLLKNGLSYGAYELRKKYMNWPINTAAPFMNEGFKVGFALSF